MVAHLNHLPCSGPHLSDGVAYSAPNAPVFWKMHDHALDPRSTPFTAGNLKQYDCVVLATDHDQFDYESMAREAALAVDRRGRLKQSPHMARA